MKLNKRSVALLVALAALLTVAVGATVAFLVDGGNSVTNTFTPSRVACEVMEENGAYTVKNTGDTQCYVRVAVVVTQQNNGVISAVKPEYTIEPETGWIKGSDGYYYYTQPLAVDASTPGITADASTPGITVSVTPSDGYTASVEVLASAIQATSDAVKDWSGGVATAATDGAVLTVRQS